ncbi:MAG: SDR family NAD(P)-dependent oxidoreductase, partial [Lewinella sp.]|nr:SDR family NAD(P)-dependent oxidoreductase [Lewinella sp.]
MPTPHLLLTGAAGNLGQSVTRQLLDEGYTLHAALGPRDDEHFMTHERLHKAKANLLDEQAAADFVQQAIDTGGVLQGAVLLVGGFAPGTIEKTDGEALEKMFRLNFLSAYYLVRPLLAHLREQGGGRIVLIGSRPALKAEEGKNVVAYALSKSLLFRLA